MNPTSLVDDVITIDPTKAASARKDRSVTEVLATRGLTLDTEWQLYAAIAGMQAAGAVIGKTEAQIYASNPGYKYAKDMALEIAAIRSGT